VLDLLLLSLQSYGLLLRFFKLAEKLRCLKVL